MSKLKLVQTFIGELNELVKRLNDTKHEVDEGALVAATERIMHLKYEVVKLLVELEV